MAKAIDRLSDRLVKSVKNEGYFGDGKGLYLSVKASGAKSWILRYMLNRKAREMGLGAFPLIGLAEARQKRDNERAKLIEGVDPIAARDAAKYADKEAQRLV
jgi:Arm DNA-binding domain